MIQHCEFGRVGRRDRPTRQRWVDCVDQCLSMPTQIVMCRIASCTRHRCRLGRQRANSVPPSPRVGERMPALCALVAAGGDLDQPDNKGETPRMIANRERCCPCQPPTRSMLRADESPRLDSIWCVNVHSRSVLDCNPLDINALQLCEILMHSFGALGSLIAFHQWWAIATKVKHFRDHKQQSRAATAAAATTTTTTTTTTNNKQRDKDTMKK
jgi:hypothetical protein